MNSADQIRQLGTGLAKLLDGTESGPSLRAFEKAGGDLDGLVALVDLLHAREAQRDALICERTFQLELALDILRTRDKVAAEQAEWDFATDLQLAGLPQDFPPFPDRTDFDLHAGMVTAKEVGGDLYDFFLLAPNRLGFVVADAAGKGLPAAIFITLTRTLLRAAAQRLDQPGDCLTAANAMLCIDNPTIMFTTAFYGVLDTETGEVLYANAGHNPPYVLRGDGRVDMLTGLGGMALGVMEEMRYKTQQIRLAPGESIVCFSDGVTEATNADGALFGEERLVALFDGQTKTHPTELLGTIIVEVDTYMALAPMADDVTLLVLRYNGVA
ncbi:PP2C family protein-serine/threonine phosphatase [Methyloferula stellata]|uniref:PP2C family protein-serine/threonine phosphatase n=1 Tax=Methyloferula stellata TaxID=876270 RepID=UPI000365EA6D|nr:PP2C family protein-serine/threonine phosphatase [Methyloferula stellata]